MRKCLGRKCGCDRCRRAFRRAVAVWAVRGGRLRSYRLRAAFRLERSGLTKMFPTGRLYCRWASSSSEFCVSPRWILSAVTTASGEVIWERTLWLKSARVPPLGYVDRAAGRWRPRHYCPGGEPDALVMAFDKHTGEEVWRALELGTEMGYSQLSIIEAGSARQLILWHPRGLSSLDPETGTVNWEEPFREAGSDRRPRPQRFVPAGFGFFTGSMMMRLSPDRPAATVLWKEERSNRILENGVEVSEAYGLHSNITTPLIVGTHIYGICSRGQVRGLRADTGERLWEAEGPDHPKPLGISPLRATRGPLLRVQRERRSRHRAILAGGLRRTRPDPPAGPDHAHRLRHVEARHSGAKTSRDGATAWWSGPIRRSPTAMSCFGTTRRSSRFRLTQPTTRKEVLACPSGSEFSDCLIPLR